MGIDMNKLGTYTHEQVKAEHIIEIYCIQNHFENYLGAISVAANSAMKIAQDDLEVSFSRQKDGICMSLCSNKTSFSEADFENPLDEGKEDAFIIKNLSDKIEIVDGGTRLNLYFFIDGINEELLIHRKESISSYSKKLSSHKNFRYNKATK